MFMCVVHQKAVNKFDLIWRQSFHILVDSEIFGQHSLYQFELTLKIQVNLHTLLYQDQHREH
jgi:hypothetical protein